MIPSELFMFFETHSLKDTYPTFINQVIIVNTQESDVREEHIFDRHLKFTQRNFAPKLAEFSLSFKEIINCCNEFVKPFIRTLEGYAMIYSWSLWDHRSLTLSFFY